MSSQGYSSFDSSTFNEFDEWEERMLLENQKLDRLIEDVVLQISTISIQPTNQNIRASRHHKERKRETGHAGVFEQYFADEPIYTPEEFRIRFRMRKPVFDLIMNKLVETSVFFQQRCDCTGRLGMSAIQKCTAAMRVSAYENGSDLHDEYLRMSGQLIRESLRNFVEGVILNFGEFYLKSPSREDMDNLLVIGARRGLPGMMGSIDCMHWEWKNCPSAWAGQFAGRSGKPTIILEAVASQDLWIWHAFFGTPGSRNDINVLDHSPMLNDILEGRAPDVKYVVNGCERNMGYYLTDGIYHSWAAFVKSIKEPRI